MNPRSGVASGARSEGPRARGVIVAAVAVVAPAAFLAAAPVGCARPPRGAGAPPSSPDGPDDAALAAELDRFYEAHLAFRPGLAVSLGLHEHDGRVPDRSATAILAEIDRLRAAQTALEAIPTEGLTARSRLEREVVLAEIRSELFDLSVLRSPFRNPMYWASGLDVSPYVIRDYAPLEQRARALISVARGAGAYYANARANLEPRVPRTWNDTALLILGGQIEFLQKDVPRAMAGLRDPDLRQELSAALDEMAAEMTTFRELLESRRADTHDAFALGEARFLQMLRDTQGFDVDLSTLERLAREDLQRNLRAIEAAAARLDPSKPAREVILAAAEDKPAADRVLAEAQKQVERLRRFLLERDLVTIPSDDVAIVKETPPFMRWNQAFLDAAGVFETRPLPSFYYISPPDPAWPEAERHAYLLPRADMLFTTIHEVWPGHFLHQLHVKRHPSRYLKSFCNYSMVEGWAHYAEEMMREEGVVGDDPRLEIGQLKEALLRDVRFVAAIGLHAGDMTVEEAVRLFEEKAFTDPATARQQAIRGTFDPMYLSYTLGKLAIRKLREDYRAKQGDTFTLKGFHDALLSHACAPLPVIRRSMLGDNAGPPL